MRSGTGKCGIGIVRDSPLFGAVSSSLPLVSVKALLTCRHPWRFLFGSTHPARGIVRYAVGKAQESGDSSPDALRHGQQDSELRQSHCISEPVTSG